MNLERLEGHMEKAFDSAGRLAITLAAAGGVVCAAFQLAMWMGRQG